MKKLLKKAMMAALFMLVAAITANAAFPTLKQTNQVTTVAAEAPPATTKAVSRREMRREVKSAMVAAKGKFYGGTKHKMAAAMFAIFLGVLGVHSFYMGQTGKGFVQLGGFILGIVLVAAGVASSTIVDGTITSLSALVIAGYVVIIGVEIWAVVDFVRILRGTLAPEEGFDD